VQVDRHTLLSPEPIDKIDFTADGMMILATAPYRGYAWKVKREPALRSNLQELAKRACDRELQPTRVDKTAWFGATGLPDGPPKRCDGL
jgi:hypothetical protein